MSSYLDKTGLERVWDKAKNKFATIATTDELKGDIETLTSTKADKTEVETAVANLVDSAPGTLNTLNELAAALGDDPNFATTVATEIGKKVNNSEYNDTIAGINANIASITPEKIGALNKEEYLGPVVLEGNPIIYENGTEGLGIAAVSYLEPKQAGSGDPSPSNIRPISGYNAMKLVRTGKNLFSGSSNKLVSNGITLEKDRGSEVTVYGSAAITLGMRVFETQLPAGTYTFSIGEIGNVNRFEPCINGTPITQLWSGDTWTLTLETAADVGLNMIVSKDANCGTESNPTRVKIQLESGADATAYKPYQGLNLSADFGQTVYGGRLDWQKGVLKADKAIVVFNGTEAAWVRHDASGLVYINAFSNPELPVLGQGSPYGVCSHYRRTTANSYLDMGDGEFATGMHQFSSITAYAIFKDAKNGASVDAWKAYLAAQAAAGTPVQVVYKLATPIEIQLTPVQISELFGLNTLYGDGSNIHAIFNTTGGITPVLESISGTLPIEKGGTGATSAAGARSNLGITPANIGALPAKGGTIGVDGLTISTAGQYNQLNFRPTFSNISAAFVGTDTGSETSYVKNQIYLRQRSFDENSTNALSFFDNFVLPETSAKKTKNDTYQILTTKSPVSVEQGGTGANNVATARSNLGVPSTTGSGASGNWGINITGSSASCTGNAASASAVAWSGVSGKPSYYDAKAIKGITRSGTTFTYTCMDGTTGTFTQQDNNTTYSAATTSANGLMTAAMVTKLNGIAEGANKYTYTLPNASSSTLGGVKIGSNISVSSGTISLTKTNVTAALGYTPLSTTGGTLTSSSDTPLTIKSGTTTSFIGFQNSSGTTLGYLGYSATNTPVAYFSGSSKKLYHSGNLKYGALSSRPSTGSNGDIYLATS